MFWGSLSCVWECVKSVLGVDESGHFTNPRHPLVRQSLELLVDLFRFGFAILCPSWLRAGGGLASRQTRDLDRQPISGPTTRRAFQSCSLIWPRCRSTKLREECVKNLRLCFVCHFNYLQILFPMEHNALRLNLTILDVDLVATQNNWNIFTDADQVTMPIWNIFVCDSRRYVKHNDGTLPLNVVTVT